MSQCTRSSGSDARLSLRMKGKRWPLAISHDGQTIGLGNTEVKVKQPLLFNKEIVSKET